MSATFRLVLADIGAPTDFPVLPRDWSINSLDLSILTDLYLSQSSLLEHIKFA